MLLLLVFLLVVIEPIRWQLPQLLGTVTVAFLPDHIKLQLISLAKIRCTLIFLLLLLLFLPCTKCISVVVDEMQMVMVMVVVGAGGRRSGATRRGLLLLGEHVLDAVGVAALEEAVFFLDLRGLGDLAARADHPEFWRRHDHLRSMQIAKYTLLINYLLQ